MKRLLLILKYGRPGRHMPPGLKFIVPVRVPPVSLREMIPARPIPKSHLPQVEGLAHLLRAMESCRACGALPKKNVDSVSKRKTYGILSSRWPMWFAITAAHLVLIFGIVFSTLWYKQSTKNETAAISKANLVLASHDQNGPSRLVAENRQPKVLGKTIVAPRADYSGSLFGKEGKAAGEKIFYTFIFKKPSFANDPKISAPNAGRQLRLFAWEKVKNLPSRLGWAEIKQGFGEVIKSAPLQIKRAALDEAQKTAGKIYALALQMQKPRWSESPFFGGSEFQAPEIVETIYIPKISLKELPKKTLKISGRVLGETIAPVDTNTLSQLVDERLKQYLAEGKFKGEKGEKGERGETGAQGASGSSSLQGGGWSLGYVNTSNPGGTGNGTIGSFTYFSSDKTQINVLNVSDQINVSGAANFTGTVSFATTTLGGIAYAWPGGDGSANQVLVTNGSGQLSWANISVAGATWSTSTNGSIYYSSGNVGIGTSGPVSVLHVVGNSNEVARFTRDNSTNVNQYFSITENINGTTLLANSATSNQKPLIINVANSGGGVSAGTMYTDFQIGGTSVMTLKGSNVGIGTTSPQANLEVHAPTAGATPLVRISNDGTGNGYPTIELYRSSANVGTISYIPTGIPGSQGINIIDSRNDTSSGIHFGTKGVASLVNINNLGNVGIGTTGPTTLLHIAGTDNAAYSSSAVVPFTTGILLQNNSATALPARGTSISFAGDNGGSTSIIAQITGLPTGSSGINKNGALTFATKQLVGDTALIERMRIDANGNVGIGTTSPTYQLDIQNSSSANDIRINNTQGSNKWLDMYSNSTLMGSIYRTGNHLGIQSYTGNGHLLLNPTANNVGIGTTSPIAKLDVYGNLNVATGSTPALFVNTATGNVGIGTNTPTAKLSISGTQIIDSGCDGCVNLKLTGTGATFLQLVGAGSGVWYSTAGQNIFARANSYGLWFANGQYPGTAVMAVNTDTTSVNSMRIGRVTIGSGFPTTGTLQVFDGTAATGVTTLNIQEGAGQGATSTLSVLANNGTTTRLTVLGTSGNVGIGTGTPLASLHVQGSGSGNIFTISSSTGAHILTVFPSGNVGIGSVGVGNSNPPNSKVFITYSDGSTSAINNGLTINNVAGQPGNFVGIRFGLYSGNDVVQKQFIGATMSGASGDLVFMTITNGGSAYQQVSAADEKMRITHYGNVGIGTTAPAALLHVETSSSTWPLLKIATSTNQGIFNISSTGNVGIGTANPTAQLHMLKGVSGGAGATLLLENNMGQVNDEVRIDGTLNGGSSISNRIGFIRTNSPASTDTDMYFSTRANAALGERMRITSLGNVGIGTAGPTSPLHISQSNGAGDVALQIQNNATTLGETSSLIFINSTSASSVGAKIQSLRTDQPTNNADGDLLFFTRANNSLGERLRITSTGNVGIGTTTPTALLSLPMGTTAANGINFGDATANLYRYGAGIIKSDGSIYAGGTIYGDILSYGNVTAVSNGNFRFGSAGGRSALSSSADGLVELFNNGHTDFSRLNFGGTSPSFPALKVASGTTPSLQVIGADGSGTANLLVTGNVGIGTTSPISKLDVWGNLNVATSSTSTFYVNTATGKTSINALLLPTLAGGGMQCLRVDNSGNVLTTGIDCGASGGSLAGGVKGYVATWASSTGLTVGTLIDNGTVSGVNATSSTVSFLVQGTGTLNPFQVNSSTGSSLLTVTPSGNVGVGTTSPNTPFELVVNNDSKGLRISRSGTPTQFLEFNESDFGSHLIRAANSKPLVFVNDLNIATNIAFEFDTNATGPGGGNRVMSILSNGNVGIGTTSPSWLLTVSKANSQTLVDASANRFVNITNTDSTDQNTAMLGFSSVDTNGALRKGPFVGAVFHDRTASVAPGDLIFGASTNDALTERMRITSAGNVGIGTTSPSALLHVGGGSVRGTFIVEGSTADIPYIQLKDGKAGGKTWTMYSGLNNAGDFALYDNSAAATPFTVKQSTGNVGIGTTSPATTLDVNGTTTMRGALLFGTDNTWDIGASGANRPRNLYLSNALSVSSITAAATVGFGGGRGGAGAGIANGADASVYATAGKSLELWADATAGRGIEILTGTGNVGVGTTTPTLGPLTMASGAYVTAGGTWTNASDRNLKENFASVTPASILEKIINLPIAKWNYKREDASITHLGPTAQDFYASFGLGGSDTSISTIDPSGVALVGIKALDEKINSLQQTVSNLQNTGSDVDPQAPIVFKTQVYLSQDSVGQAKILAGSKRVKVTFTKPYEYQPIVTATPLEFVTGAYRIASTTTEGFTIEIKYVQDEDTTFNFHAFASSEAKLTVSDGQVLGITLTLPFTESGTNQPAEVTPSAGEGVGQEESAPSQPAEAALTPATEASVVPDVQTEPAPESEIVVPESQTTPEEITPEPSMPPAEQPTNDIAPQDPVPSGESGLGAASVGVE